MIKKLAGAAVSTLLIASFLTGSVGVAGATPAGEDDLLLGALPTAAAPAEAAGDAGSPSEGYAAYLFVHFVNNESLADHEQIYFSVSENGTDWTTLNDQKPIVKSNVGEKGVRDPHIIRTKDNKFVIIATDLSIFNRHGDWGTAQTGGSRDIVVWKSDTIDGWQDNGGTAETVGTEDALDVWAPESVWDVDKQQYMVTWASIIGDRASKTCYDWKYRIYRSYTTDFENFTAPEVYMEREDNIIDTTFYYNEENETYYRFTKDEDNGKKWVFMEQGKHIDGDFEMVATYSIDGKHYSETTGVEGPTVYKDNTTDKWYLLLDNWTYIPYETADITEGVFTTAGEFKFNGKTRDEIKNAGSVSSATPQFRHGSVLPITQEEYDALLAKYPNTADEPDPETGKLIYELNFEDSLEPTIDHKEAGAATIHGSPAYIARKNGGKKALEFDLDTQSYLSIPGSLFAGLDCFTVSFMAKIPADKDTQQDSGKGVNWLFLVQKDDTGCSWQNEKYLSVLWEKRDNNIVAQRFNITNAGRPEVPQDTTHNTPADKWVMITVIFGRNTTKLYINAELKSTVKSDVKISELLGEDPVAYLGYATWSGGEYSYASIDTFRVYDGAIPQSTMQAALTNESLTGI